jgi:hypothetical protein
MVDDPRAPGGAKRLETTDEFARRVAACLHLYAALLGTPGGDARSPHPHPAANGWAWLARHLNALPATRVTAVALQAFVAHAGGWWRRVLGGQGGCSVVISSAARGTLGRECRWCGQIHAGPGPFDCPPPLPLH